MKVPSRRKGRCRPEDQPGGKALERLHQFEVERGLKKTEVEQQGPGKASPKRGRRKKKETA